MGDHKHAHVRPGEPVDAVGASQIESEGYEPIIGPVAALAAATHTSLTGVVAEAQA